MVNMWPPYVPFWLYRAAFGAASLGADSTLPLTDTDGGPVKSALSVSETALASASVSSQACAHQTIWWEHKLPYIHV